VGHRRSEMKRLRGAHLSWEGPTTHGKAQIKGLGVRGA
jgi:hypothetical protein